MAKPQESPSPNARRPAAAARRAPRIARALAQATLLAAGAAAAQAGGAEMDKRFHLFNPTLVDRLRAPVTRLHE
ncbi:MAG TPA: hypothetical protein VN877_00115 [Opitutaceae bacterium]|nr:hypothetical protein [Opitutaceae bacterium]